MNLSQLEQPVGYGWRPYGGEAQARQHGGKVEAAVEPVAELVSGSLVDAKTVPAVSEVWWRQCLHCNSPREWTFRSTVSLRSEVPQVSLRWPTSPSKNAEMTALLREVASLVQDSTERTTFGSRFIH
jgi:hypothetical protein